MTLGDRAGRMGRCSASGPGDLTRWMAVPWQTDTSSCLSAYKRDVDGYLPTFWPARAADILTSAAYRSGMIMDPSSACAARAVLQVGSRAASAPIRGQAEPVHQLLQKWPILRRDHVHAPARSEAFPPELLEAADSRHRPAPGSSMRSRSGGNAVVSAADRRARSRRWNWLG